MISVQNLLQQGQLPCLHYVEARNTWASTGVAWRNEKIFLHPGLHRASSHPGFTVAQFWFSVQFRFGSTPWEHMQISYQLQLQTAVLSFFLRIFFSFNTTCVHCEWYVQRVCIFDTLMNEMQASPTQSPNTIRTKNGTACRCPNACTSYLRKLIRVLSVQMWKL